MELTVFNLVRAGSEYWELWQGDGANRDTCAKLRQLWDTAAANSAPIGNKCSCKKKAGTSAPWLGAVPIRSKGS